MNVVSEGAFHSSTFHGSNGNDNKASADKKRTSIAIATAIPRSSNTSSSSSSLLSPSTTPMIPRENDVLCGRGGLAIWHPGNKAFRALVHSKKPFYQSLGVKSTKREVSMSIVATVRNNGGRFLQLLQKRPTEDFWCEIGDKKAIDKTCQALRERTKNEKKTRKKLSGHASSRRSAALRQTMEESKSKSKPTKGRSNGPAALENSDHRGHNHRGALLKKNKNINAKQQGGAAMAKAKATTIREPIAVLNANDSDGFPGGCWEWKLFDFCDEDQTRQDDQLMPHQTTAPAMATATATEKATAAPCPSTICFLSREQQRQQQQLSAEQMLSSPRLCGSATSQPLAPPASMPQPFGASPVKKE